jgi:hypothetical protein
LQAAAVQGDRAAAEVACGVEVDQAAGDRRAAEVGAGAGEGERAAALLDDAAAIAAVPRVSVLGPSRTVDPATPDRPLIVWLPELFEMSKVAPAPARFTPLDVAMLPKLDTLSVAPAMIVVEPV